NRFPARLEGRTLAASPAVWKTGGRENRGKRRKRPMKPELSRRRFLKQLTGIVPLIGVGAPLPWTTFGAHRAYAGDGESEPEKTSVKSPETVSTHAEEKNPEPSGENGKNTGDDGNPRNPESSLWVEEPIGGPVVVLRHGGRLTASISLSSSGMEGDPGKRFGDRTFSFVGWSHRTGDVPLHSIAGIVVNPPSDPRRRDRLWDQVRSDSFRRDDYILLNGGDRITGRDLTYHATAVPEYSIRRSTKVERIPADQVVAVVWGTDSPERWNGTPRDAEWVGLDDGSLFAIHPEDRTTRSFADDSIDEIGLYGGGWVDADASVRSFHRPRVTGRRTLSGMESDLFRTSFPFGTTIPGDLSDRWGRDRTPDGMTLRERGRSVPFGVTQPIGSRLGFPVIPAYTGVFSARFSVVPIGTPVSGALSVMEPTPMGPFQGGVARIPTGTAIPERMTFSDRRFPPICGRVFVSDQLSHEFTAPEIGAAPVVVRVPLREATRLELVVDQPGGNGTGGDVPGGTPAFAMWADAVLTP
ncbi:MAG: hypothetical protein Q4C47_06305, partial [Planctomycetia bacterium]|nr:hypothetical protein [Planctomycetia bacterium]